MLILDKTRALDLMIAHSERAAVPEEFSLGSGAEMTAPWPIAVESADVVVRHHGGLVQPAWSWWRAPSAAAQGRV